MSGYLGDLSPCQEQALEKIRLSMSDVLESKHDDHLLLQFLRARRFDLKKAEDMFRKHLQFRQQYDEEHLQKEYRPPELLIDYIVPPLIGYDKGGSPVRLVNVGPCDIKGVLSCIRRNEIRKCITWMLDTDKESMRRRSHEMGLHLETRTFIFDLNGLSLRQIYHKEVYELVISFLKLYEGNYPENLKVAFVINTPSFFAWMFSMIKSLLSEDTIKKIKIYGYGGWKEDLLDAMDPEILPVAYGGVRTDEDGDPRCRNLIPQGGSVPTRYYLRNQRRLAQEEEGVSKVVVGRRSKLSIPVRVEVAGSAIGWEVDCKNSDLHLSLVHHPASPGSPSEVVLQVIKVSDDLGLESGCFLAEKVGNLFLDVYIPLWSGINACLLLTKWYLYLV